MSDFVLHPETYDDLDKIWEYIATSSIDAADCVREEIFEAFYDLVPFPHRGRRREDLTTRPLRFITLYDYLIAYTPEEKPLVVIPVLHGRRNPDSLAAALRSRR